MATRIETRSGRRSELRADLKDLARQYGVADAFFTPTLSDVSSGEDNKSKRKTHFGNRRDKNGNETNRQLKTLRDALVALSTEVTQPIPSSPKIEDHTLEAADDK